MKTDQVGQHIVDGVAPYGHFIDNFVHQLTQQPEKHEHQYARWVVPPVSPTSNRIIPTDAPVPVVFSG
ncbi:hypothetical protein GCM10027423_26000 [Spirosoma arcticum]